MLERRNRLFPRMKMMVPSTTTSPTECQTFMAYDFKSQLFQAMFQIPSYIEWLNHEADLVPTYRYVKRVLKLLQWHCPPNRWRLKNPSHCLFIDALAEVFPDARFWMTHRDVASVIPSVADLYYELTKAFSDAVDTMWLGRMTTDFCELGMRRMMAFRDAGNDHSLCRHLFHAVSEGSIPVRCAALRLSGRRVHAAGARTDGGVAARDAARQAWRTWCTTRPISASTPRNCGNGLPFYSERFKGVLAV